MTDTTPLSTSVAANTFWTEFTKERQTFVTQLADIDSQLAKPGWETQRSELATRNSLLRQAVAALEDKVTQALLYLPPYDERRYRSQLEDLKASIRQQKERISPRTKFSFRTSRAKPVAGPTKPCVTENQLPASPAASASTKEPLPSADKYIPQGTSQESSASMGHEATVVDGLRDTVYIASLPTNPQVQKELLTQAKVLNCTKSVINLLPFQGRLGSVLLKNLTHCVVLVGPQGGSMFVEHCQECVVVVACHQLRAHTSSDVWFCLHTTSRPIIEECHGIGVTHYPEKFAPVETLGTTTTVDPSPPKGLDGIKASWETAGLWHTVNKYDNVDDFKWLRRQPSPHWRVISPTEINGLTELWDMLLAMGWDPIACSNSVTPMKSTVDHVVLDQVMEVVRQSSV
ncbi:hypothetical protein IWQ62_001579 [Dispira parvispora]|uniref:C-CAP/cofactor C-like domain-containing protein n=1 Tax=Dispira parvispora TaxID=1520584 RepID=A0A9W8E4S2_9FUNG|nr:hypothetical protein IWQ62_001579 [Dispira parvispora]